MASVHILLICIVNTLPLTSAVSYTGTSTGLTTIPTDIPLDVTKILLDSNYLVSIPSRAFSAYTQLRTLDVKNNRITTIGIDAFESIQNLNLKGNQLNDTAQLLSLSHIGSTLQNLNIGNNPLDIDTSPYWTQVESAFTALQTLTISGTGVSTMPSLRTAARMLVRLYAGYTALSTPVMFEYVRQLTTTSLDELYLDSTTLTTFPDIRGLVSLFYIRANVLHCDSRIAWMKEPNGMIIMVDDEPCMEPARLVGVAWSAITADDLEPYIGEHVDGCGSGDMCSIMG